MVRFMYYFCLEGGSVRGCVARFPRQPWVRHACAAAVLHLCLVAQPADASPPWTLHLPGLQSVLWEEPCTTGQGPCPRSGHTLTAVGGRFLLFGGNGRLDGAARRSLPVGMGLAFPCRLHAEPRGVMPAGMQCEGWKARVQSHAHPS